MNWYLEVLKKYVVFDGRAHRTEFWMFCLFNIIISIGLGVIEGLLGIGGIFSSLYSLAVLLPSLAVTARRLHDTDRSAWWMLVGLVPLLGALVLLFFAVQNGTAGSNRFGSDPKMA